LDNLALIVSENLYW